jgi:hypothetical protein
MRVRGCQVSSEERKVGGSTPPLTTTLTSTGIPADLAARTLDSNGDSNGISLLAVFLMRA